MSRNKLLSIEIWGAVIAVIFGSMLHFTYALSGYNKIVALVSAVNESTWEHLKLGFWPIIAWGVYEYLIFGKKNKSFFYAKMLSVYTFCLSVPVIFYSYKALLGRNYLVFDILTFIISVVIAYFVSYRILKSKVNFKAERISMIFLILLTIAFLTFSFYPPKMFLFLDPVTNGYGSSRLVD